ncbi:recombinase family protein [Streptomyces sp. NPDC006997]|uniref:recombinase family protein n=1 Tax=Streptomyces sp. NPDC006997 TaxID=3155356 RepID=UPI0033E1955F
MPVAPEFLHLVYPGEEFPAYLYGRASRDPKRRGRSVSSQLSEGRALCLDNGWPIRREFKDIDRSASAYARTKRDEFEEMVDGIVSGDCRILVAFEASRYYRDLEVYVRLRRVCREAGVLLCYNGQVYDLSKSADRKATARDAVDAESEAENIRERNLRTTRQNAAKGGAHGPVLDGYKRRYDPDTGDLVAQVPDPDRASLWIGVFRDVAGLKSLRSILLDLRARGVLTHRGKPFREYHIRQALKNRGYIGRRMHNGVDVGKAMWPPLSDDETTEEEFVELFHQVQDILSTPGRNLSPGSEVAHLQSHIALCGEHPDNSPLRWHKNAGIPSYGCSTRYDTSISETRMDAYVEEAVITWLSSSQAVEAFEKAQSDDKARKARLRLKILEDQLRDARARAKQLRPDGQGMMLSIESLADIEAGLTPEIEKARAESRQLNVPPVLQRLLGKPRPDVDKAWNKLTLPQRRLVLRLVVTIRLFKARTQGVRKIEPGRITLSFYGEPGFRAHQVASRPAVSDAGTGI